MLTLWPNVYISFWGLGEEGRVASLLERLHLDHMFYDLMEQHCSFAVGLCYLLFVCQASPFTPVFLSLVEGL